MQVRRDAGPFALSPARSRHDRGIAAVEFAIVVPLLMMVVFGIMGFGFAMAQSASLASGARAGARLGAVGGTVSTVQSANECRDVVAQTRQQAQTIDVDSDDVEVTVYRVTSAGSAASVCAAAKNSSTVSGLALVAPCTLASATAADEATIRVTTTLYDRAFVIPVPGASVLTPDTLTKTAEYRCEYH